MADFKAVGSTALARAEGLLQEWLPGGRFQGREYVCAGLGGDAGRSFSCNVETGAWADFAGGDGPDSRGGDLVSLYAAIHRLKQSEACAELAHQFGLPNGAAGPPRAAMPEPAPKERRPTDSVAVPVPSDAEDPPATPHQCALEWYTSAVGERLYAIARIEEPDGKRFLQWTWRNGKWSPKAWPAPRPLYRLDELTRRPDAPVLIVEGEKCANAARLIFPEYVVTTWSGGANSVGTADLAPLKGRTVTVWPDNDVPGRNAAAAIIGKSIAGATSISVVTVFDKPEGWDVSDFAAESVTFEEIRAWVRDNSRKCEREQPKADAPGTAVTPSGLVTIQALGLLLDHKQKPVINLSNVSTVLQAHPRFTDHLWYDSFRQSVWHDFYGKPEEWSDEENRKLTVALQQMGLGLERLKTQQTIEAVCHAADLRKRNSVTTWLESLKWDGTERLTTWLADFMGAPQDEARAAIGTNWLVAMVRRAYQPGCQCDYVIVLEGGMGIGKTESVEILGAPWHSSLSQKFGSKEFNEALRAKWLIEIPDLSALEGREHGSILAAITRRTDVYRRPYDRLSSEHARTCLFVISTEKRGEYLADMFGIRRFWPVPCTEINVEALRKARGQLFAEALHLYRSGHQGYVVPESLRAEQIERVQRDLYHDRLLEWLGSRQEATNVEIYEAIFAPTDNYGRVTRPADSRDGMRIARVMRRLGWEPCRSGSTRGWRRPPAPLY